MAGAVWLFKTFFFLVSWFNWMTERHTNVKWRLQQYNVLLFPTKIIDVKSCCSTVAGKNEKDKRIWKLQFSGRKNSHARRAFKTLHLSSKFDRCLWPSILMSCCKFAIPIGQFVFASCSHLPPENHRSDHWRACLSFRLQRLTFDALQGWKSHHMERN